MGVYGGSTFHQGDGRTPPPHPAPPTSSCTTVTTIGNSVSVSGAAPTNSTSSPVGPLPIVTPAPPSVSLLSSLLMTFTTPPQTTPPTTTGTSATRTSSGASSTSSPNAAPAIRLPGSRALIGLITIVVGASIFYVHRFGMFVC